MNHGLVLQVAVPLIGAPLCLLLRSGRLAALLAALVAVFGLYNALDLLAAVRATGPLTYRLGDVPVPFGIGYRLDQLNAYVLLVVAIVGAASTIWAACTAAHELGRARRDLFFATWLLCLTGLYGITVTGDAFNVFVFLEVSSLSGYVLVAGGGERRALVAAFRYLIMGTIGATFVLIGIGLLYAMTGTLNMQDLAAKLPAVSGTGAVRAAFAFLSVGLCLKIAVFPLHVWLPAAYATAPSPVSALLAGTATKVAVYLWLRFFFGVFAPSVAIADLPMEQVLLPLGLAGAVMGSLAAAFQDEPKRVLAWSSIGQVGYLVTGLGLANTAGATATLSHLLNHAVAKTALFLALGVVVVRKGVRGRSLRLADLRGLGRQSPFAAAAVTLGGLSLIGVPLTAGFVGKWLLLVALLEAGLWWATALVVLSSLLAVVYVWRLVEVMYFRRQEEGAPLPPPPGPRVGALAWAVLAILCGGILALGVWTDWNVGLAREAATVLLQGGRR